MIILGLIFILIGLGGILFTHNVIGIIIGVAMAFVGGYIVFSPTSDTSE